MAAGGVRGLDVGVPAVSRGGDGGAGLPRAGAVFESIHKAQFKEMPAGFRKLNAEEVAAFRKDRFSAEWMPRQEAGTRPATALPYELYASGALEADGKGFGLLLEARKAVFGAAAAGTGFHVYTPGRYFGDVKRRSAGVCGSSRGARCRCLGAGRV